MKEQIYPFLVCILFGVAGGALYEVFACIYRPFKHRAVRIAADLLFSAVFSVAFVAASVWLGFPAFRFYMLLGCLAGFFLYQKSLHKIVAFFARMLYNGIEHLRKDKKL